MFLIDENGVPINKQMKASYEMDYLMTKCIFFLILQFAHNVTKYLLTDSNWETFHGVPIMSLGLCTPECKALPSRNEKSDTCIKMLNMTQVNVDPHPSFLMTDVFCH